MASSNETSREGGSAEGCLGVEESLRRWGGVEEGV